MINIKCKNCKYCKYIQFDGYKCEKFNSHIPEKLIDEDTDCLVKNYNEFLTQIYVNEDGVKDVKSIFLEIINFL